MKFTQYDLECLSQASYQIGDETTGRAVVVDPRRDIDEYVRDAEAASLTIELVIETHFHADFLSGHLELAAATGAATAYSDVAHTEFESRKLVDGERIDLGELDPSAPTVLYCAGGYRSSVAASVLREAGFSDVSDVLGGYGAWQRRRGR